MIIPVCKELITARVGFTDLAISVDYASLQGKGFSLKRSQAKYGDHLTESEVISHPTWIKLVEKDITLLGTYTSIVFNHRMNDESEFMAFYLLTQSLKDQVMSLYVANFDFYFFCDSSFFYDYNGVFLRAISPS